MSYEVLQTLTAELLHLDEVKNHLRVSTSSEDELITALIVTARVKAESFTKRALVMRQIKLRMDHFPSIITPEYSPLQTVDNIQYVDTAGATQTLATSYYTVDRYCDPAQIFEAYNQSWPTTRDVANGVTVTFTTGYMAPFSIDTGTDIFTVLNNPFINGDVVRLYVTGSESKALPTGLSADTDYYIVTTSSDTFQLAASSGGSPIDVTGAGTGTFFIGREIVPQPILQAMKLMITDWYYNRGNVDQVMPEASYNLLLPYSLDTF